MFIVVITVRFITECELGELLFIIQSCARGDLGNLFGL
jgi:hypothetical protein